MMEALVQTASDRQIRIDECKAVAITVVKDKLMLGVSPDKLHYHAGQKKMVGEWKAITYKLALDVAEQYAVSGEEERIRFLTSIGAVFVGISSDGPSFLVYPRRR